MNWRGPFFVRCECGWESRKFSNPIAASWSGEAHLSSGNCSFKNDAARILRGEKVREMPDRKKYFKGGVFLKADDIEDGQTVIVESFEEAKTRLSDEPRPILRFKGIEAPLGLNATNFDKMIEKFGDDEKKWVGKRLKLTLVKANNPQTKKEQDAIRIA